MPLARGYSPNPQAQKEADVGPSPYQQMSAAFASATAGPTLKIFQYTILPAVRGVPIVGRAFSALEYLVDPIGELKKELNIAPSIGGGVKEAIISHSVAGAVKIFAAGLGAAQGEKISNSLVQNAIAYEWANTAAAAKRNPGKFLVQQIWNGFVKGEWFFDRNIYDKTYLFYKAADHKGVRHARWRNHKLFEGFNRRAEKYGVKLEGAEQKLGAYSFATVLEDKKKEVSVRDHLDPATGNWVYKKEFVTATRVPFLKGAKIGWQIAGPTLATVFLLPPLAPAVFIWQVVNAEWGQFIKREPLVEIPDAPVLRKDGSPETYRDGSPKNLLRDKMNNDIREFGEFRGNYDPIRGIWVEGGQRFNWHKINEIADVKEKFFNKLFKNLEDFFTLGGWYRLFITGETLRERALLYSTEALISVRDQIYRGIRLYNSETRLKDPTLPFNHPVNLPEIQTPYSYLKEDPTKDGWQHVGYNKETKTNIYEQVIKLSNGEVSVKLYKDAQGVWQFAGKVGVSAVANRTWWILFHVQQVIKTVVSRFALPLVLALNITNPLTLAFVAYSAFKGIREISEPLKWVGWKRELVDSKKLSIMTSRFGKKAEDLFIILKINGDSRLRRFARRLYSVLSPFDREVGALRGLLIWRDKQWDKFVKSVTGSRASKAVVAYLAAHPRLARLVGRFGRLVSFVRGLPIVRFLFRAGGVLLGGVKWVVAPGQALKDAAWSFVRWATWKGIKWAVRTAYRRWFARPVSRLLVSLTRRLPANSLGRRLVLFFLRRSPKPPRPLAAKVLGPSGRISQGLSKYVFQPFLGLVQGIIRLFMRLAFALVKTVVKVIATAISSAFKFIVAATAPLWGPLVAVALAIVLIALLIGLVISVIIIFFMGFTSGAGANPYQSPPSNNFLEIRKVVANPKAGNAPFTAGETVRYTISYKIKAALNSPLLFEDKFLIRAGQSGGGRKYFFDADSLNCQAPANISAISINPDPAGPGGEWKGLVGTLPNRGVSPDWVDVTCSATIDSHYSGGSLFNHAVVQAVETAGGANASVSQFLSVNSGGP